MVNDDYIWYNCQGFQQITLVNSTINPIIAYVHITLFAGFRNIEPDNKAKRLRAIFLTRVSNDESTCYESINRIMILKSQNWSDLIDKAYNVLHASTADLNNQIVREKINESEMENYIIDYQHKFIHQL